MSKNLLTYQIKMKSFNEKEKKSNKNNVSFQKIVKTKMKKERTVFHLWKEKKNQEKKQYMAPQSSSFGLVYYMQTKTKI